MLPVTLANAGVVCTKGSSVLISGTRGTRFSSFTLGEVSLAIVIERVIGCDLKDASYTCKSVHGDAKAWLRGVEDTLDPNPTRCLSDLDYDHADLQNQFLRNRM